MNTPSIRLFELAYRRCVLTRKHNLEERRSLTALAIWPIIDVLVLYPCCAHYGADLDDFRSSYDMHEHQVGSNLSIHTSCRVP